MTWQVLGLADNCRHCLCIICGEQYLLGPTSSRRPFLVRSLVMSAAGAPPASAVARSRMPSKSRAALRRQGLTLVHFSAQPELFLTKNAP